MPKSSITQHIFVFFILIIGVVPLVYFFSVESGIAEAQSTDRADAAVGEGYDRYVENVAFGVGEKLEFDVRYGFIQAGTAVMEVPRLVEWEGRPSYQIITTAHSNSFVSTFFHVEDHIESIVDAFGLFSWHFNKQLHEGKYEADRRYSFDQENHIVVYKEDTVEVEPFVQDAISSFYYVRTLPLKVGESVFVSNFIDGKKFDLEVKVHRRERITVPAGTFDCLVVEPLTEAVGVFKNEGKLTVWLTDDRVRMPVLMKSKVLVGSISVELRNYALGELADI